VPGCCATGAKEFYIYASIIGGLGRVVGIATCYGLDGRGTNPGGSEISHTRPDRPWVPPRPLYKQYPFFSQGWSGLGVASINNLLLALRLKKGWRYTPTAHPPCLHGMLQGNTYLFISIITTICLCGHDYILSAMISVISTRKSIQGHICHIYT
jgi:hypothetical protein